MLFTNSEPSNRRETPVRYSESPEVSLGDRQLRLPMRSEIETFGYRPDSLEVGILHTPSLRYLDGEFDLPVYSVRWYQRVSPA
ncbi:MAG: hypothetical protein ACFB21_14205 [Opitutales bacterium]